MSSKEATEEEKEVTGRWRRSGKQLLHELKEKRVCRKLKEEVQDRTVWKSKLGRFYGPFVRQTRQW